MRACPGGARTPSAGLSRFPRTPPAPPAFRRGPHGSLPAPSPAPARRGGFWTPEPGRTGVLRFPALSGGTCQLGEAKIPPPSFSAPHCPPPHPAKKPSPSQRQTEQRWSRCNISFYYYFFGEPTASVRQLAATLPFLISFLQCPAQALAGEAGGGTSPPPQPPPLLGAEPRCSDFLPNEDEPRVLKPAKDDLKDERFVRAHSEGCVRVGAVKQRHSTAGNAVLLKSFIIIIIIIIIIYVMSHVYNTNPRCPEMWWVFFFLFLFLFLAVIATFIV